jgi:hypothetical protein
MGLFDDLDWGDQPAYVPLPRDPHWDDLRGLFGEPRYLDALTYIKPAGLDKISGEWRIRVYGKGHPRMWAVAVDAANEEAARKIGGTLYHNLVGKRSLTAADFHLYDTPLYVVTKNAAVECAPPKKVGAKKPSSTTANEKNALLRKGRAFFGAKGVSISGNAGSYRMSIRATLKAHQRLFREQVANGATIAELSNKLDGAIAAVKRATG